MSDTFPPCSTRTRSGDATRSSENGRAARIRLDSSHEDAERRAGGGHDLDGRWCGGADILCETIADTSHLQRGDGDECPPPAHANSSGAPITGHADARRGRAQIGAALARKGQKRRSSTLERSLR